MDGEGGRVHHWHNTTSPQRHFHSALWEKIQNNQYEDKQIINRQFIPLGSQIYKSSYFPPCAAKHYRTINQCLRFTSAIVHTHTPHCIFALICKYFSYVSINLILLHLCLFPYILIYIPIVYTNTMYTVFCTVILV